MNERGRRREHEEEVRRKERRRIRARRERDRGLWHGLGLFGLVGWGVSVPTLPGLALGLFLDARCPGRFSWTLTLLAAGVILGSLNAWYWITREREEIEREKREAEREEDEHE